MKMLGFKEKKYRVLKGIRAFEVKKNAEGIIQKVRLVIKPHYCLELQLKEDDGVEFLLGTTHHDFHAEASEVDGELEKVSTRSVKKIRIT